MNRSGMKILVVDDDSGARETIKDILEEKGHEALTAESGKVALEILEKNRCDVVLLDLVMPETSGIEVLEKIKAKYERIDILIITGYAEVSSAIKAVNGGAFAYVPKPINVGLLDHYLEELADKRETERKLIESEMRYRTLFENSPEAIILLEDVIIDCNAETCRFLGYERDDIIGHRFLEFAPPTQPDGRSSEEVAWERIGAAFSKTAQAFEWMMEGKDGEIIDAEMSLKVFTVGSEQVLQVIMRDITKRKRAEKALTHRADFERLIARVSTYLLSLTPDELDLGIRYALEEIGKFSDVDRSYLFILSDDETRMDNTHEWCREGIDSQVEDLQGLRTEEYKWWMDKLNRHDVIYVPSVADLPPDASSEKKILQSQSIKSLIVVPLVYGKSLIGFLGFDSVQRAKIWEAEDITLLNIVGETIVNALKRKETEEALRESEEKYRYLAENAGDLIYTVDMGGNFTFMNKGVVVQSTGYTIDNILSMNIKDVLVEKSHRIASENLDKRRKKEGISPYEIQFIKKGGDTAFFEVNGSSVIHKDELIGVQGVARDITRRKALEGALRQQTRNANFYLDLMTHDITNFNQVILGYLDLLNTTDKLDDDRRKRYLHTIRYEFGKMISLIGNVKILSRIDDKEAKLSPINLVEVIKDAIENIEINEWTGDRRVNLKFTFDDKISYHCMADELAISIFTNLLNNAIKYTPSDDVKINIELEKDEGATKISITDRGVGISDEQKGEVFQRYMRVDEGIQGSGIGLSLVSELVKRYNGKVWIEDRVEGDYTKGARFVVRLPAMEGLKE
ncbi:MAG: aerobic respiration control sensor protein ArcB [Candidatus Syntrophoarchaeum sp. GoM_oil]|nr:MAG: aerobic respiration control sensor protein ArcB [Candidatus Syntrophoarchaeum sp. GoM_oil]